MVILEISKDELTSPVKNKNPENKTKTDLEQLIINKMYTLIDTNHGLSDSDVRILELLFKNKD